MKQNIKNTSITATALRRAGKLTVMACAAMLAGCTADDTLPGSAGSDTPVVFTTSLQSVALPAAQSATPHTRIAIGADGETVWTQGDAVGIIMLTAGQWTSSAILPGGDNVKYTVDPATGKLTPATGVKPVVYPDDGSKVRFVAYYPYVAKGSGNLTDNYVYPIDVTDQSDPASIDLLYAVALDMDKSQPEVALTFSHVLSKIKLDITLGEGLTQLSVDDITAVTLAGVPATVDFLLLEGRCYRLGDATDIATRKEPAPSSGATATFTAIIVPHDPPANGNYLYFDRRIIVTVDGVNYTGAIPNYDGFWENRLYVYPVTVRKNGIELGTPTIAQWTTKDHGSSMAEFRYTVSFDANGGTGPIPAPLREVGSVTGAALPGASGLTPPAGLSFVGWNTAADYSGMTYKAGETFTPSRNTTLYAVWEKNSKEVVAKFKSYFFKENGQVRANKLPSFLEKEWAVGAEDGIRACEVFSDITGVDAPLTENYEYTYSAADGKCTLRLVGTDLPKEDGLYAILYVEIEDCPEISIINICITEYLKNDNMSMSGVPVIL